MSDFGDGKSESPFRSVVQCQRGGREADTRTSSQLSAHRRRAVARATEDGLPPPTFASPFDASTVRLLFFPLPPLFSLYHLRQWTLSPAASLAASERPSSGSGERRGTTRQISQILSDTEGGCRTCRIDVDYLQERRSWCTTKVRLARRPRRKSCDRHHDDSSRPAWAGAGFLQKEKIGARMREYGQVRVIRHRHRLQRRRFATRCGPIPRGVN